MSEDSGTGDRASARAERDGAKPGAGEGAAAGPRLPYRGDDELARDEAAHRVAAAIRERRAGARLLNLDRMLLHSPPFAEGWNALLGSVRQHLGVPARLRELAICAVARLNEAPYEWDQHVGEWQAAGASGPQIAALAGAVAWWEGHPPSMRTSGWCLRCAWP